jgi:hypothetical protein
MAMMTPPQFQPVSSSPNSLSASSPPSYVIPGMLSPMLMSAAHGVVLPVDITVEGGEHKGISTCEFIRASISCRSPVLISVIKVLKTLLYQTGFNVPFNGGLSSYSTFLMVCAAYDTYGKGMTVGSVEDTCMKNSAYDVRKIYEAGNAKVSTGRIEDIDTSMGTIPADELGSGKGENGKGHHGKDRCSGGGGSGSTSGDDLSDTAPASAAKPPALMYGGNPGFVSEGGLLRHFLQLFSHDFDPAQHGLGN